MLELPYRRDELLFFDYLISARGYEVPVERKTAEDFVASIVDGRIFAQTAVMSAVSPYSILVVEGTPSVALMERRLRREAYMGALASIMVKRSPFGARGHVNIVTVDSYHDTALLLRHIHKRLEEGNTVRIPQSRVRKVPDPKLVQLQMLTVMPGVGTERALRLIECFGSLANIMRASVHEIASVDGIGYGLAARIKYYLCGGEHTC